MAEAEHNLFLMHYRSIHDRFARYCANHSYGLMDAEDLMQETILATIQRFELIREKEKLLSYMISAANNIIRNHLRRKKFSAEYNEKAFRKMQSTFPDPEIALDVHHLHLALQQLPVKDKEAVLLFEVSGFSIEEIAAIQSSTSGATKTRLSRAREKIRQLLSDDIVPEKTNRLLMML
jgi:RNA polymerase sigma-70 factor, ECF subfamily